MAMAVQTFEAETDDEGNIRLADNAHLPSRAKVYILVPEQTTLYAEIVPETNALPPSAMLFPSVRVTDKELAKRLVKTVVEDARAEL